jgi:hypothetical protein
MTFAFMTLGYYVYSQCTQAQVNESISYKLIEKQKHSNGKGLVMDGKVWKILENDGKVCQIGL